MIFWIGLAMVAISMYLDYADVVLVDPLYSFAIQESLTILGTMLITRSWIFRSLRRRKK